MNEVTFKLWMCLEALPLSYFFTSKVSSPLRSGGEMGVYGRIMGLPLASLRASGSEDLTMMHEATGSNDASLSGSAKMNLTQEEYIDL